MILKSYEISKIKSLLNEKKIILLYGENYGLKKEIQESIKLAVNKKNIKLDELNLYENEIIKNDENFYDLIYSGSLFSNFKIISIQNASDKITSHIENIEKKTSNDVYIILFAEVLEKKSKLRSFFESSNNVICVPCYLDSEKDLIIAAQMHLKKNNIVVSREILNLLVEKSNSDRGNLKNEIEKIKSFSLNKKNLNISEIKSLINFTGDHKSDVMVNICLSGNIIQYKKIITELYTSTINQILLLRILSNKIQRLLKIKEEENKSNNNIDALINNAKPTIFWKEKPIVKRQLSVWKYNDLMDIADEINNTELLCKKNPQISKIIFFKFFNKICNQASNYS